MFNKELLNFQKLGLTGIFFISLYKLKTGEWSLKKAANTSLFKIDSFKAFEMKMLSRRLCMKPEQRCCLKVNLFVLGLLILQVSYNLKVSVIPISFETNFSLKDGLRPQGIKSLEVIT